MKSDQQDKIIYIAPALSSFVKQDIEILSKKYQVTTNIRNWYNKFLVPIFFLDQLRFVLWNIHNSKVMIISFGGYWSFFPTLIGKIMNVPTMIILNGTDCASIPQLNYGSLRKGLLGWFCKQSYKRASVLLPVSSSLVDIQNTYFSNDQFSFQGYKHFFPNLRTRYEVISNGVDQNFWRPTKQINKDDNSFISVFSSNQFVLKGGDLILDLSKRLPECTFYIAGLEQPNHLIEVPKNVLFLGKLHPDKLREYYCKSQFHYQLSIFEGFGLSLCEAMLCECIPIGSSVNIIPEIIGDTGYILKKRDIDQLEKLTLEALKSMNKMSLRKKARIRIIENYSVEKRIEQLNDLLSEQLA